MRPLPGQPRPEEAVREEQPDHEQQDPARRAAHRLQHEQHEGHAEEDVSVVRQRVAVPEVVAAGQQIGDRRHAERGADDVPPHQPVAVAGSDREEQEDEQQRPSDVNGAQHLRGDDLDGGVEMEQRHPDEQHGRETREPAAIAVGGALLRFDVRRRLLQALLGHGFGCFDARSLPAGSAMCAPGTRCAPRRRARAVS